MEDVMEELQISRGKRQLNLRALTDQNCLQRTKLENEESFYRRKDLDELAVKIARERSKERNQTCFESFKRSFIN
jgi:hypothetical protein